MAFFIVMLLAQFNAISEMTIISMFAIRSVVTNSIASAAIIFRNLDLE